MPATTQSGKQVFHVKNNKHTYDEAKALCKAFDSDLADYKQIEDAYNNGAEWCSYGWSKDGMALYPTQLSTWKTMQQIKDFQFMWKTWYKWWLYPKQRQTVWCKLLWFKTQSYRSRH